MLILYLNVNNLLFDICWVKKEIKKNNIIPTSANMKELKNNYTIMY